MARKLCIDGCGRPQAKGVIGPELCDECLEYAEWENTHSDGSHIMSVSTNDMKDPAVVAKLAEAKDCPVCHPKLDPRRTQTKVKKVQGFRRTQLNHKEMCTHAQTPKARRTCKNAFWAGVQVMVTTGKMTEDQAWEHCIKALTIDQAANASLQAEPVKKPTKFTVAPKGHVGVGGKNLKATKEGQ